ncbi:MAG TPA: UDP-N-acetylmuramate--L-alanine ligase, partial [Gemmatimonadales bacterium]|nr:UDP-N-acetylmuramate--L-alanine ligase [Gemmatimonadales bacterium]
MTLFAPGDPRPVHFVGIGGAGMSGLAALARHLGVTITGCDTDPSGAADLAGAGVQIWRGHDPGHVEEARAVVVTAAVPWAHAELERARARGIPVVRRADALGEAVSGGTVVAIAGTHGKTTTTVMVTEVLTAAGRNPTGLAGGRVATWGGNARVGDRTLFVVEADEYDRAFLSLDPAVAVVGNVEADHLECYGSLEALEDAFVAFAQRARRVIAGADDAGASRVAARTGRSVWRVGFRAGADVRIVRAELSPGGSSATVRLPDGREVPVRLRVPGRHNLRNAAAALAVAVELGADVERGAEALAEFGGVGRRFERVGEAGGVVVMDDYAHHPTEVAATLEAARQVFPGRRLVAVFQPHLYSRTAMHGTALGQALAAADLVVVAPIYPAREQPLPGVTADLVARGAISAGAATVAVRERAALADEVMSLVGPGDVVFTLGAGDVTRIGPELLRQLATRTDPVPNRPPGAGKAGE